MTLPVATGSSTSGRYGVRGIPDAALIGPDGKLVWSGHPSSLSKGKIEEALKGARKPAPGGYLAFNPDVPAEGALAPAVSSIQEGSLGKAYEQAGKVADDERADAEDRENARALLAELDKHVSLLRESAESLIERLQVLEAVEVLEGLAKALGRHESAGAFKERVAAIKKDERLSAELDAAEAFAKLKARSDRLSTSRKRKAYEDFARRYPGTKAAERALAFGGRN